MSWSGGNPYGGGGGGASKFDGDPAYSGGRGCGCTRSSTPATQAPPWTCPSAARSGGVPTWKSEYIEGRQRSHKGTAGGLAIQIAAAGDKETAADTSALSGGTSTGAATFAFIQAIEQHGTRITYGTLLLQMDKVLHSMGGGSSMGGMLDSLGVSKMLGGFSSGSKVMGMLESGLSSAGLRGGQTPQLSANYAFDVNTPLQM